MTKKEKNMGCRHLKSKIFLSGTIGILLTLSICVVGLPPNPNESHWIAGEAYYYNGTTFIPADGANVTVINERTSEKLYDTVGPLGNSDESGYYIVNLSYFSMGFEDGDNITVVICGTGDYIYYIGTNSTTVNTSKATQIVNVTLIYDLVPPVTTENVGEPKYEEYLTSATKINFTAADEFPGVNKTYYRVWYNGSWAPADGTGEGIDNNFSVYTENITLDGEGLHYIEFYSVDNAGNNEVIHNQTHYVDNTPPETNFTLNPSLPDGEHYWYVSDVTIALTGYNPDPLGVDFGATAYRIDGGEWQIYTAPFSISSDGTHSVEYYSVDKLGNQEDTKAIELKIDKTSPVVSHSLSPANPDGENGWYKSNVKVTLNSVDEVSNINITKYRIDGGEWHIYDSTITLSTDGNHEVDYYTIDNAGNNYSSSTTFKIDKTPPSVSIISGPSGTINTDTATFSWTGSDNIGAVQYRYGLNGEWSGWSSVTTNTFSGLADGSYTFSVQAKDEAGNTNTQTRSFTITTNEKPAADFSYNPLNPTDTQTIHFTDNSDDTDGTIVNYTWNFGDGNTSHLENPTHKYEDNGTYTVTLTVTDDKGATDTISKQIEVLNEPPTAYFKYEPTDKVKINEEVVFTDESTDKDGTIVNYTWNFGDGNLSYEKNPTHKYGKDGAYTVTLTVTDNDGATDEATLTITVEKEQATSVLPIIAIMILIIIAIAVVFIWRNRTQKQ